MNIFFLVLTVFISNIVIDISCRKFGHFELHRKISHISGGIIVALMIWFSDWKAVLLAGLSIFIGILLVRKYSLSTILEQAGKQKRWYGELYFVLGMLMTLWVSIYHRDIAVIAVLVTTLADGFAPFWRIVWGKPLYQKKTFGGSIVFFLVTSSIIHLWLALPLHEIVIVSLLVTITELLAPDGADNLLIPLTTSALLFGSQFI